MATYCRSRVCLLDKHETFAQALARNTQSMRNFWRTLASGQHDLTPEEASSVQRTLELGAFVKNHSPLVQALLSRFQQGAFRYVGRPGPPLGRGLDAVGRAGRARRRTSTVAGDKTPAEVYRPGRLHPRDACVPNSGAGCSHLQRESRAGRRPVLGCQILRQQSVARPRQGDALIVHRSERRAGPGRHPGAGTAERHRQRQATPARAPRHQERRQRRSVDQGRAAVGDTDRDDRLAAVLQPGCGRRADESGGEPRLSKRRRTGTRLPCLLLLQLNRDFIGVWPNACWHASPRSTIPPRKRSSATSRSRRCSARRTTAPPTTARRC